MGRFLEAEKQPQAAFKANSPYFSDAARAEGIYRRKPRPFCLPREHAEENLFDEIRTAALTYFAEQRIKWHEGEENKPSNHLCSSQVCCVNFLFPFALRPRALLELLRRVFPTICRVLPMEEAFPDQFVSFEWIGEQNYLGERVPRSGRRTRGANFTSADGAVMFELDDGTRRIALIEWKYTESYGEAWLRFSSHGTDRAQIYGPLYEREDCPLNKLPGYGLDDLFYDPFDQLMRQQFLAHEMEQAHELGAAVVSVLHIAPAHNHDFRNVTSPGLRSLGESVIDVWKQLVRNRDRFTSVSVEGLFGHLPADRLPELARWWQYVNERYRWLQRGEAADRRA